MLEENVALEENLVKVKENIKAACERAGRDAGEVTLVAVSKMKPLEDIETLLKVGQLEYGENYVQELCEKEEHVSRPVHWHMIGHLQTNKVKYIIDKVVLIHSVDSVHLAKQIEKEAAKKNITAQILLQVNVAEEDTKFGMDTDEVLRMAEEISQFPHVHIRGLMTSAPFVEDPEENRCYFRKLHKLFVDIGEKNIDNVTMDILSMGMTNDYEVAIEEGATMIRVGTGIFGERDYNK
ncbi:MAG TPA: YggS family pyridoxal phosphate-dependent enzyme [Candidatus Anaerobutyricum faecale]|nr:YggS family pyridoxal phosphate-dependent enzyme [Candidatus Anaerobutyricum faecale]